MKTVQLHFAHVWDCDNCGEENLARRMVAGDGDLLVPDLIECWNCKCIYKAEVPEEEGIEDDD